MLQFRAALFQGEQEICGTLRQLLRLTAVGEAAEAGHEEAAGEQLLQHEEEAEAGHEEAAAAQQRRLQLFQVPLPLLRSMSCLSPTA